MVRTARLFGGDVEWSTLAEGSRPDADCHVELAKANAEQVVQICRLVEELGFEIATPVEAPAAGGAHQVRF
jgi:hypothetical protein